VLRTVKAAANASERQVRHPRASNGQIGAACRVNWHAAIVRTAVVRLKPDGTLGPERRRGAEIA